MAYDEAVAARIRTAVGKRVDVEEKRMFGGVGFRPMKGWILIAPAGLAPTKALENWVDTGLTFAGALPKKRSAP